MDLFQYDTASDIPSAAFGKTVLYGRVERVVDGDTIRIRYETRGHLEWYPYLFHNFCFATICLSNRHYPFFPIQRRSSFINGSKKNIADHTISVRLYGVDAPELGKYGNPSMPYADEAKKFTKSLVEQKIVRVKLLNRDRYARVIGRVTVR